ncbi:MAG: ribonuclease J [Chloroflexi bacterium]|jgi:ribonuclease J|nr:ribonuclease J [Chloroflexota bacterium]MCH2537144.1 ribonuclease J [Dehalococcoidia bacterium]MEE2928128.1 ribonuclease J [Chloroflexota bacterium]HIB12251.1 ribonuclease J [Dehalococcoidia bacterium]|tara:strand:- start:4152 stop:5807 length:1656 start_codon:yes stop_codon:yes gene_type:complete
MPPLRIIPLGGLGEIGKNMMAVEYGDDIVVIDCGVQFPDEDMPGVDLIIPDVSYLVERADRVKAILITHGHEDHIGALPFILPQINVPVYAPRLAHGLISVKLNDRRPTRGAVVEAIEPGIGYQFGDTLRATWFRVCHSIPDAMGIAIETPRGLVVHTGDFKIDHTPVDGRTIDLATLARHGAGGVLLLLSDSTYAEVPGYTQSERVVGEALDRAIADAPGRVMVATFASLISRVQQVVDAAEHAHRKVGIVGRSMEDNVAVATEMGYLKIPPGILQNLSELRQLPPNEVVLLTTGSQGEPTSALVRIANKDHRDISVLEGDTVIISATPIPGNELGVGRTIDNLMRQGATVLYDRISTVHVHGHASQEELKMMLNLVRPRYFVPVHGEYRHLMAHAQLAWDVGVAESGIFVLEDGDVLELSEDGARVEEKVPARRIYVDGANRRDHRSQVFRQRRTLSKDGVVVVVLSTDKESGRVVGEPKAVASGFMEDSETEELFQDLALTLSRTLAGDPGLADQPDRLKSKMRETAREFLASETNRRPIIIPVVLEV